MELNLVWEQIKNKSIYHRIPVIYFAAGPHPRTHPEPLMPDHPRVTLAPETLAGKPVIRGTRLSVEFVIGLMAEGWSEAAILQNYAGLTHEDIIACLAYARDMLGSERVFPSAA